MSFLTFSFFLACKRFVCIANQLVNVLYKMEDSFKKKRKEVAKREELVDDVKKCYGASVAQEFYRCILKELEDKNEKERHRLAKNAGIFGMVGNDFPGMPCQTLFGFK